MKHKACYTSLMDYGQIPYQPESGTPGDANGHLADVILRAEQELHRLIEERADLTKRISTVKQNPSSVWLGSSVTAFGCCSIGFVDHKRGSRQPADLPRHVAEYSWKPRLPMRRMMCGSDSPGRSISLPVSNQTSDGSVLCILGRLVEYGKAKDCARMRGQTHLVVGRPERDSRLRYVPEQK